MQSAFDAYTAGRLAEAERQCLDLLRADPGRNDLRGLLAIVLAGLGRHAEAEPMFRELAAAEPGEMAHRLNLGCVLLEQNRLPEAEDWLRQARAHDPGNAAVNFNLGMVRYRLGEMRDASGYFELALGRERGLVEARVYLARACLEMGEWTRARAALNSVTEPQQLAPAVQNDLALAWAGLDEFALAEELLQRVLLRDPTLHEARINLAYFTEKRNQAALTRSLLDSVPEHARDDASFALVQARVLARDGRNSEALACLDRCLAREGVPVRLHSEVQFERGKLLDRLERHDEAFTAWQQANDRVRDNFRRFHRIEGDERDPIAWLERGLDTEAAYLPGDTGPANPDDPIFIVGFPRSGTTLLDQILDAHPRLQVLEEKPALDAVVAQLRHHPRGFPDCLTELTPKDWAEARRVYRNAVAGYLDRKPGTILVDKYPLHMVRVPLIRRLFPGAKIVLALRHPCDAVLSCFMQNFRFTEATHGFWSIEGSARIYDQLMRQWLAHSEKYRPDAIEVRYERLVEDFRGEVERLITFLGVGWDASVLDYQQHALKRGAINTPSYNQVVKPIYKSAIGRWRHYRRHFESSLDLLGPHLRRFGYDA